uniref:Uncharacterized protein n=1 Tax=Anguilla anguilla TaxID=7936 RepID=A0A0E9U7P0_ANGAN
MPDVHLGPYSGTQLHASFSEGQNACSSSR